MALPARTHVAVVGDGVAGLALTDALHAAGRACCLITQDAPGNFDSPSLGVVRVGPSVHLARLAAGHGRERAAACVRAGLANRELLEAFARAHEVRLQRGGTLRFASDAAEASELRASVRLLESLDRRAGFDGARSFVDDAPERFTYAAWHADDATVDETRLKQALAQRVSSSDVPCVSGCRTRALEHHGNVQVVTTHGTLTAEVAIVASEELLPSLVSFCRFKIVPMRVQALAARAAEERRRPASPAARAPGAMAWSAVHGYENWMLDDDERVVRVSGSRDLPVKKELGARRGTTPEVQALLEGNLSDFARLRQHRVQRRWSSVQGASCDALPLVGGVPGRARVLVCGGFGINDVGWAFVAARTIVELLENGRAEHEPVLSPRRFL